ncbi:Uncharacterized protein HZ326_20018 [Fusarium oxysporum f. sp. albedinis]|nr:hypothetical protein FOFC_03395 [Fusarium oxysporum]KAJ0136978.1 Uncharacterized protein HZ326_20018 [Fusarium oxysporum f. sp. albedinis]
MRPVNRARQLHGSSILAKPSYSVTGHSILLLPWPSKQSASEVEVVCLANDRDYLYRALLKPKLNYLTVA